VVHRDLKPANIMMTKSGAKLLDFGLAKLKPAEPAGAVPGSSALLTQRTELTAQGSIVGTLVYMAPEQLEGKESDARSDIFSFGSVVYEAITGRRAFEGKSQASVIAAILTTQPQPVSAIQPMTPPALDRVVSTCLAKDPDERWQSARDLSAELKWISEGGSQAGLPAPVVARRRSRERLAWAVAAALAVAAVALGVVALRRPPPAEIPAAIRFTIPPPEKSSFDLTLALSPDGRRLAFTAALEGKRALWVRPLNALDARPVPDTTEATMPFWSPDSRHVGFFADGKLKRVDLADGSIQSLASVTDPRGGSWGADGTILFTPGTTEPIYRVAATGGEARPVTSLESTGKENSHRWPCFLPDGRHFLYFSRSGDKSVEAIYAASLDGGDRVKLIPGHSAGTYVEPGYIFYIRDKTLTAQPFDAARRELAGEPITVAQNVELVGENGPSAYAAFSVTGSGTVAYLQAGSNLATRLIWFDRAGRMLEPAVPLGYYDEPMLSPDGRRVVLGSTDPKTGNASLWLLDLAQQKLSRFTFGTFDDGSPIWSPDGTRIAWSTNRSGFWDLYWKQASGVSGEEPLLTSNSSKFIDDWTRDGRFIVYEDSGPETGVDLWLLPLSEDRKPRLYLQSRFNETHSQVSPDGRWIAYASDESGRGEIYVQTFPAAGGKFQISTEGGDEPLWRRDGKELYFLSQDRRVMAVDVSTGEAFEASAPKALFTVRTPPTGITGARIRYAPTSDGQRFLVVSYTEEAAPEPMRVIVNWLAEARK